MDVGTHASLMLAHAEQYGSRDMPQPETVGGNRVRLLRNMDQVIPDMVDRIRSANTQIDYTMFAADGKEEGRLVLDALKEAARNNIPVNAQFDQVGTFVFPGMPGKSLVNELRDAGANVVINRRFGTEGVGVSGFVRPVDHRKIMVVDGETFYLGGMNIAGKFNFWRDTMVRVDGPAAAVLGATVLGRFSEEGMAITDAQRGLIRVGAAGPAQGDAGVSILINTPGSRLHASEELVHALRDARDRAWIMTPNISNPAVADEVAAAAMRGVDTRLSVTKGDGIAMPMDYFTMSYYQQMLDSGVAFFRQGDMEHSKIQLIDNTARVGSMNLTRRAMTWDHEISAASADPVFVRQVEELFESSFKSAQLITAKDAASKPAQVANFLRKYMGLRY